MHRHVYVDALVYIPVVYVCILISLYFYKFKLLLFIFDYCLRSVMDPAVLYIV